jgi:hypothetical protein
MCKFNICVCMYIYIHTIMHMYTHKIIHTCMHTRTQKTYSTSSATQKTDAIFYTHTYIQTNIHTHRTYSTSSATHKTDAKFHTHTNKHTYTQDVFNELCNSEKDAIFYTHMQTNKHTYMHTHRTYLTSSAIQKTGAKSSSSYSSPHSS